MGGRPRAFGQPLDDRFDAAQGELLECTDLLPDLLPELPLRPGRELPDFDPFRDVTIPGREIRIPSSCLAYTAQGIEDPLLPEPFPGPDVADRKEDDGGYFVSIQYRVGMGVVVFPPVVEGDQAGIRRKRDPVQYMSPKIVKCEKVKVFPQVRHLTFEGGGVDLHSLECRRLLLAPPHDLFIHEKYSPITQRHAAVNTDGAGEVQEPRGK